MDISRMNNRDYTAIASGKKIHSAADDAAGLAIANKLEAQSNGLTVGADNAKSGIHALNIADGALGGINDYLQEIRELSVKAMNGTNSASDLEAIQKQIDGAMKGIVDIAGGTEYNTMKLLDGSMADMDIASNPDGSGMKIRMANATLENLGIAGYDVTGDFNIDVIDQAIDRVNDSRATLGAGVNALEYAQTYNSNAALMQTRAQSGIEDTDIARAISERKKNDVLEQYRIMMQKEQSQQESLVTKMFR